MASAATVQRLPDAGQGREGNSLKKEALCLKRRGFLKLAALSIGGLATSPALANVAPPQQERALFFYNPRTGETTRSVYWTPLEGYLTDSIQEVSWALRDYRTDEVKMFDARLLDVLYALQVTLECPEPFHVICGYRSPSTNAMLRLHSRAVAKDSFHMYGMAADIRMPGRHIRDVYRMALSFEAGGVGYYPYANFVHVDSGPIRSWR